MRRVSTALIALAVVLFAVPVAAGAAGTSRSVTFHLVEKQVASNFVDNPPRQGPRAAPLMGDEFVFTSDLATKSGQHAGLVSATCMIATGGIHASGPCYGVFSFKGGQLMAMAKVAFSSNTTEIVVVGGTGVYRGATGYIVSVSRGENSPYSDDTFHLQLP